MFSKIFFSVFVFVVIQSISGDEHFTLNPKCPKTNGVYPVRFPHETDCNLYYTCDWGNAILQQCPPELHFGTIGVCVEPEKAGCIERNANQAAVPPQTSAPVAPAAPLGVAAAQPRSYVVDPDRIQADNRCPKSNPAYPHAFRHSKDCTRYYVCNWGLAIPMFCPPELAFNEITKTCDFKQRAGC